MRISTSAKVQNSCCLFITRSRLKSRRKILGAFWKVTSFIFNFIDRELSKLGFSDWWRVWTAVTSCLSLVALGMTMTRNRMPSLSPLQAGLRTPSGQEGYTKENEITVLNFDKSKQVVCEICLEKHKKARHSDDDTCFYCSEWRTLICCMFYFLRQKNKVGSACKFSFVTRDSVRLESTEAFGSRPVEVIFGFEKDAISVLHSEHFFRVGTIIIILNITFYLPIY